ncbi:MAG: 16S rRNA (cytosine(967)-C(5))-methyltransferase RsmB [Oscillospiraceae bacterium]|nr:16S rRNA (cytosine(967)-C(5))-methyltransferase RsmB [Oscillospiraceae bacterium]
MSARETALQVLKNCRAEGGWANSMLKEQLARDRLDRRDAALATRLAYGVLQNRALLDHYLQQLLTGRLKDLRPVLRDILHLGLYQILFLDKIPESAAVNESVDLAKRYCKKQKNAAPLVNGVLRNAARSRDTLVPPADLATRYSHPAGLVALFKSYVGEERLEAMLSANNAAPDTVIQVNTLKTTAAALMARLEAEGVEAAPHRWMENCLVLKNTGALEKLPAFLDGEFYVQDAAARLAVDCAGITEGDWLVTDCCAAPGGKSFAAAMALGGRGQIVSSDIHEHKVPLMEKGAERLGFANMHPRHFDATVFDPGLEGKVDFALVDVPCSGYGIIRKKPDIREKDPDTMKELPKLQLQILQNQSRYVRPGGVLLYSTCTLVRRENEGVVEKFLKANPEFKLEPLALPAEFGENTTGMLTLVPGEHDTDGFFIARLRRKA